MPMKLTGNMTVGLLEIIQSLFTGMSVYAGFRITRELFHKTNTEIVYLLLAVLCLPQYLYAMFIYGESLGICATMYACFFSLQANREGISIKRSLCYYAVILFPVLIMTGKGMTALAEKQAQTDYGDGCPKIMWVAMGLQENEEFPQFPGTYNGFNADTYKANDYDAFFSTYYMQNQKEWVDRVYFDDIVHSRVVLIMDNYQFLIYLMLLVYFLNLLTGKDEIGTLLPVLILVGGFLFSLIWEGRSRYVYPYLVIALPCVAEGVYYAEQGIEKVLYKLRKKTEMRKA